MAGAGTRTRPRTGSVRPARPKPATTSRRRCGPRVRPDATVLEPSRAQVDSGWYGPGLSGRPQPLLARLDDVDADGAWMGGATPLPRRHRSGGSVPSCPSQPGRVERRPCTRPRRQHFGPRSRLQPGPGSTMTAGRSVRCERSRRPRSTRRCGHVSTICEDGALPAHLSGLAPKRPTLNAARGVRAVATLRLSHQGPAPATRLGSSVRRPALCTSATRSGTAAGCAEARTARRAMASSHVLGRML